MKVPFLDLGRAYQAIAADADAAYAEIARSGQYILGSNVAALEAAMRDYLDVADAVACGSGTDALHLALAALGVGEGHEVITTPFTFAATVEAIEYLGATPVLVDIDPRSYNIDVDLIEAALTPKTRAVIPVHMFGRPAAMPELLEFTDEHGLLVIEDTAQSFGAAIGDQRAGSFGDAGAFSFYPTKTLGCLGDGGLVAVQDADIGLRLRELRNHGIGKGGEHLALGWNSRLDEIQAAILRFKFAHIDAMNDRRREIAARYNAALADTSAITPPDDEGIRHVHGYYTLQVEDRDAFRAGLADKGVATALYYPRALHQHAHFSRSCRYGDLPEAEKVAAHCVSLPIFPEMRDEEVDYVAECSAALLS